VTAGQRPQFITQQPRVRQVETRLLAPAGGSVAVRNVPAASFVSPQQIPQHQISSLPQQSPRMITVAEPSMSFSTQPAAQSQVYTGISPDTGIPPRQPVVYAGQPNFPSQNFIRQQQQPQAVNIIRPVGGATVHPVYRNVEPLTPQQPPNQTPFLLPTPSPVQQPPQHAVIYQRLLTPPSDRPPFDANVVRTPVSLPGYVDFSGGNGSQVRFTSDFYSDPEIVGQPIETVIHHRNGQERMGDSRGSVGFGQNKSKNFPGVR